MFTHFFHFAGTVAPVAWRSVHLFYPRCLWSLIVDVYVFVSQFFVDASGEFVGFCVSFFEVGVVVYKSCELFYFSAFEGYL